MKVLIADKLSSKAITDLENLGMHVTVNPDLKDTDLPGAIGDNEVLIVRSTRVTADTINAAISLSLVVRAGAGVNTIDLDTASENGIYVANCPGENAFAVAELAIGLLIAADRRIVDAADDLRNGRWRKKTYQSAHGLKDRTLGIIGLGSIGRAVLERAKGLQMHIIAWSRSLTPQDAQNLEIGYCASPEEVAEKADAVTVHIAAKSDTNHMINTAFFNKMKPHAIFINTSRGEVVDTQALRTAIKEKELRVGLDVFENEPKPGEAPFEQTELAKIICCCTPHIGASTDQASEAIAATAVNIVKAYKETGKPINTVNIRKKTSAIVEMVVRHYNRVGVLAGLLNELKTAGINIEEMENTIFENGLAASCTLRLDEMPTPEHLQKIRANKDIIQVFLE
jgi:D-3-phosphoglycerate dehydrogenase